MPKKKKIVVERLFNNRRRKPLNIDKYKDGPS